jgi:hypothetical protein
LGKACGEARCSHKRKARDQGGETRAEPAQRRASSNLRKIVTEIS